MNGLPPRSGSHSARSHPWPRPTGLSRSERIAKAAVLAILGIPLVLFPDPLLTFFAFVPFGSVIPLALFFAYYATISRYAWVAIAPRRAQPRPGANGWEGSRSEYALILSLILITATISLVFLGGDISKIIDAVAQQLRR